MSYDVLYVVARPRIGFDCYRDSDLHSGNLGYKVIICEERVSVRIAEAFLKCGFYLVRSMRAISG